MLLAVTWKAEVLFFPGENHYEKPHLRFQMHESKIFESVLYGLVETL